MSSLSIGYAPGTLAIWFALLSGAATCLVYYRALGLAPAGGAEPSAGYAEAIGFGRRLYAAFALSIVLASVLLMKALLSHDFRLSYVTSYSGRDLPTSFLLSTFWAGQEGSFLLWVFFGALIGFAVYLSAREQEAPVMIVYVLSFLGIVAILAKQPPFRFLAELPADGQGLNPLLQDYWMVIHPPVMFAGFASLSVPFAFALAALWQRRWDGWVVRAMPWALFTLVTLGTAILMGGYWAYKTLGWGGYWAWDPVENTSLVPWLATVALVHGMFLQKTREKHRKINLILAIVAYCCILYGTFLTRSGVLADFSVHSFVDLGITGWLVAIIVGALAIGFGMLAWRWREIPVDPDAAADAEEPFLSRSVLFILAVTLLSASAVVILLGTSSPLITRVTGKPAQVATSFYNITHTPLAAVMALLLAFVPFVSWKGETWGSIGKKAATSSAIGLLAGVVALLAGIRSAKDVMILTFCGAGLAANLETTILFVRRKAIRTMGGYLSHVGVAIMLAGILVSGVYERKEQVTLPKDTPVMVGRHEMTFRRTVLVNDDGVVKLPGELDPAQLADIRAKQAMEVEVKSPGGKVWKAYPKMYVNQRTNQMMANPDVQSTPLLDIYVSPQSYDPGQPAKSEGTVLHLKKGETKLAEGTLVKFLSFDVDMSQMDAGAKVVAVTANFEVGPAGAAKPVSPKLIVRLGGGGDQVAEPAPVPGSKASLRMRKASASEGIAEVEVLGLSAAGDTKPATPETFSVDVTTKPLISLVWAGFYILTAGGILAMVRRARDAHRSALV